MASHDLWLRYDLHVVGQLGVMNEVENRQNFIAVVCMKETVSRIAVKPKFHGSSFRVISL